MNPRSPSQVAIDRIGNVVEEFTEEMVSAAIMHVKENLGPEVGISPSTLSIVIKYTMEAVEKTHTKGPAQMDFAVRVIGDLIGELPNSDEKAFLSQTLDNGGIKNTIELIVQATRGEINVNQVVEVAGKSCIQPCIDYIVSKCI